MTTSLSATLTRISNAFLAQWDGVRSYAGIDRVQATQTLENLRITSFVIALIFLITFAVSSLLSEFVFYLGISLGVVFAILNWPGTPIHVATIVTADSLLCLLAGVWTSVVSPGGYNTGYFLGVGGIIVLYVIQGARSLWAIPSFLGAMLVSGYIARGLPLASLVGYALGFALLCMWSLAGVLTLVEMMRSLDREVTRQNRQATRTREAVEALKAQQDTFSASQLKMFGVMAHELRTPAAAAHMLVHEPDLLPRQAELQRVTTQMLNVIDDIRVVTNADSDFAVAATPFSLREISHDIEASIASSFNMGKKQLKITQAFASSTAVVGDGRRVRNLVMALIRNAFQHSGGNTVFFSTSTQLIDAGQVAVAFAVADNGQGLDDTTWKRVLKPFQRGEDTGTPGMGLGLHIVRSWCEKMGGELSYQRSEHGGACFTISLKLPLYSPEQSADAGSGQASAIRTAEEVFGEGCRVLLVEDDWINAKLITSIVKRNGGWLVTHAGHGEEALGILRRKTFDVIITDYHMPTMDGVELTRRLREQHYRGPIIGLTAATLGNEVSELRTAGADDVLAKPLIFDQLHQTLLDHALAHGRPA